MPLAAFATWQGDVLQLDGAWGEPDVAKPLALAQASAVVRTQEEARALGAKVAAQLRVQGARPVLVA